MSQPTENTGDSRVADNLSGLTRYLLSDIADSSREYVKQCQRLPEIRTRLPFRFLVKIDFRVDGCWIWIGATRPGGTGPKCKANPALFSYGVFSSNGQANALIHAHLEAVTHKENMARWSIRRRSLRAGNSQETREFQ